MEAVIVNFRRGRHRQNTRQIVIKVQGVKTIKDTEKLLKKAVSWTSPGGKEIKGTISASHGNSGCVRAIFERGLPGQALGQKVIVS
ncbi:MAG: 50S ribosomal protein L35ae [Nanoarchaeota archaeon]|nr:50S ribosomal protein L35ae [Nanoarchaeota archaeon]